MRSSQIYTCLVDKQFRSIWIVLLTFKLKIKNVIQANKGCSFLSELNLANLLSLSLLP